MVTSRCGTPRPERKHDPPRKTDNKLILLLILRRCFLLIWTDFSIHFCQKSTNINEAFHGLFHRKYAIGGKGHLAAKSGITQNKLACCSISSSHSQALLNVLLERGLAMKVLIASGVMSRSEVHTQEICLHRARAHVSWCLARVRALGIGRGVHSC